MTHKNYKEILQIKISLMESNPLIWRRVLAPSDFTLKKFHDLIQIVMGWQNSHLHQFIVGDDLYSDNEPEFEDEPEVKPTSTKLSKIISANKIFSYEYDFGDRWLHEIKIEKILPPEDSVHYPLCIGGENACPPEDCFGIDRYYKMLEDLNNPKNEEHLSTKTWLGGFFDPKSFDPNRINRDMLWMRRW